MRKLRILTVLYSGLCLVSCDKPDAGMDGEQKPGSARSASHGRLVLREQTPQQPADFHEMLEDAKRIEAPLLREKALAEVAWNSIEFDQEIAHEAFRRLPEGSPEKIRLIQHYAMRLAAQDPEKAIAWADTLASERETAAAMGHVALEIAEADPLRAAHLLSESGIVGRDFDVVLVQVIQRWVAQSAPDAAAWVSTFPQGEARVAGIKTIMERWLPHEPSEALGWFERIQDKDLRDEAARVIQGVILQQPKDIRESWLQHASVGMYDELQRQSAQAMLDVGDNIPPQP